MRISTRQLSSIIKEAIQSPIDLDSMSDKDLQNLLNKVEQILKQREETAKRNSFASVEKLHHILKMLQLVTLFMIMQKLTVLVNSLLKTEQHHPVSLFVSDELMQFLI